MHTFQVENVQLGNISSGPKAIIPLAYKDAEFTFPSLVCLLPNVEVASYNHATGQLVLSLEKCPQILHKLVKFQDMLLTAVHVNQTKWFDTHVRKMQDIRSKYQPLIIDNTLHLYCPLQTQGIPLYSTGGWTMGSTHAVVLEPGKKVKIVFKLQGISFHIHPASGAWSGKFRLQHRIIAVLQGP
jgi:hypothetical protein